MGDRTSLERALVNLCRTPSSMAGRHGVITIAVDAAGAIEVSDQGAGVPLEHRERIFGAVLPAALLQERGAGLGLHLVQEVVRRHNGRVSVEDGVPTGARFRIILPLAASHQRRPASVRIAAHACVRDTA